MCFLRAWLGAGRALFSIVELMLRTLVSKTGTTLRRWYKRGFRRWYKRGFWWQKALATGWLISLSCFEGVGEDLVHSVWVLNTRKIITQVLWQRKWPLWCSASCSIARVDKGNKDFLFGDSPSTGSTKLEQSLHGRHVLGQKRKQQLRVRPTHGWRLRLYWPWILQEKHVSWFQDGREAAEEDQGKHSAPNLNPNPNPRQYTLLHFWVGGVY